MRGQKTGSDMAWRQLEGQLVHLDSDELPFPLFPFPDARDAIEILQPAGKESFISLAHQIPPFYFGLYHDLTYFSALKL